jgi:hypothetical protein
MWQVARNWPDPKENASKGDTDPKGGVLKDESPGNAGLKSTTGPCWTDSPPRPNAPYWNGQWVGIVRMAMWTMALQYSRLLFILLVLVPTGVILILHILHLTGFEEVQPARNESFK